MTSQYQQRTINDNNPFETLIFRDDFLSNAIEGNTNWQFTASGGGSGTGSRWGGGDLQNHPGVASLSAAAGASTATIAQGTNIVPAGIALEAVVQVLDINDPGVDEHTFGFGFNTVGAVNSMVIFHNETSPNWLTETRDNGASTGIVDSGIPVVAFEGYRLRILANISGNDGNGIAVYTINDTVVASTTMGVAAIYAPAVRLSRTFASSQSATAAVDMVSIYQSLTR